MCFFSTPPNSISTPKCHSRRRRPSMKMEDKWDVISGSRGRVESPQNSIANRWNSICFAYQSEALNSLFSIDWGHCRVLWGVAKQNRISDKRIDKGEMRFFLLSRHSRLKIALFIAPSLMNNIITVLIGMGDQLDLRLFFLIDHPLSLYQPILIQTIVFFSSSTLDQKQKRVSDESIIV